MRIISGNYRGRKLVCAQGQGTRPTTDRVKEAIFGRIQFEVMDANILDLFAGSGALGIESLSRGAKHCDFIENDPKAISAIETNISGMECDYTIKQCDFTVGLKQLKGNKYDIIFLDPPYSSDHYQTALNLIYFNDMLADDGLMVLEMDGELDIEIGKGYELEREKKYGKTKVLYYRKGEKA